MFHSHPIVEDGSARDPGSRGRRLGLVLALCGLSACATPVHLSKRAWHEHRTEHFQVLSDSDPEVARGLARDLQVFRNYLGRVGLLRPLPAPPVRVFATRDTPSLAMLMRRELGVREGTVGMYWPTVRGDYAVAALEIRGASRTRAEGRNILFHEYVHAALARNLSFHYPKWYDEGLAEYLATFEVEEDGASRVGLPLQWRINSLSKSEWISLRQLLLLGVDPHRRRGGSLAGGDLYGQAWVTVHFFNSSPVRFPQLMDYLVRLNRGEEVDAAFSAAFDVGYTELNDEIQGYFKAAEYSYSIVPPDASAPAVEVVSRSLEQDEVLHLFGQLALYAQRWPVEAKRLFLEALALNPARPDSMAELAHLHLYDEDLGEARRRIESAESHGRESAVLATARGRLALLGPLEPLAEVGPGRQLHPLAARPHFERAIALDPLFPEALWRLGRTYLYVDSLDRASIQEGLDTLRAARVLLPRFEILTHDLALLHARAGELGAARELLREIVRWSRSDEMVSSARALLKRLEPRSPLASPGGDR